jgi:hypothetical protein
MNREVCEHNIPLDSPVSCKICWPEKKEAIEMYIKAATDELDAFKSLMQDGERKFYEKWKDVEKRVMELEEAVDYYERDGALMKQVPIETVNRIKELESGNEATKKSLSVKDEIIKFYERDKLPILEAELAKLKVHAERMARALRDICYGCFTPELLEIRSEVEWLRNLAEQSLTTYRAEFGK